MQGVNQENQEGGGNRTGEMVGGRKLIRDAYD